MTIFGWDASHYDAVPDGARVVAEGFAFMTHKAGGDANDAELAAWWQEMKPFRGKLLLGAYWVLYPGSATGRADSFLARLDAQCPGWRDGPFILQVDCEKWNGDPGTVPSLTDIETFCDRLAVKAPKSRPIVYAPKWVYGDSLKGLSYPLWASSYVSGSGTASALYPGDGSSRWGAYSGQTPAILQFSSSATIAGQTTSDANAYRGTLAELTALLAPGWEQDMELDELLNADEIPNDINPGTPGTPGYNENMTVRWALRYAARASLALDEARGIRADLSALNKSLTAAISALAAKDAIDEAALAAELAPAVAALVIAGLPQGSDQISQEEVTAAVKATFADAFAGGQA